MTKWLTGVAATVVAGVLVWWLTEGIRSRPDRPPPPAGEGPLASPRLKIHYSQRGGPFFVIGPNPGGVFAPNHMQGYTWHEMDIMIENRCNEAVYIDPGRFSLYLSSKPSPDDAQRLLPTTLGREYQTERLASGWLQPATKASGRLIFEVPEKTRDGTETNGAYHIVRYYAEGACPAEYKPH